MLPYWIQFDAHDLVAIKHICRKFGTETENGILETEVPSYYSSDKSNISGPTYLILLILPAIQAIPNYILNETANIIYKKKLQAIYLMLYKRWYKTAKIQKYKHEHYALATSQNKCLS